MAGKRTARYYNRIVFALIGLAVTTVALDCIGNAAGWIRTFTPFFVLEVVAGVFAFSAVPFQWKAIDAMFEEPLRGR
jgi:hypothetical protein